MAGSADRRPAGRRGDRCRWRILTMTVLEPVTFLAGLLAAIQDSPVVAGVSAAGAAVRPDAVERGLRFLAGAYGVVWAVLGAYLVILSLRLRRVARQVRRLRERLGL